MLAGADRSDRGRIVMQRPAVTFRGAGRRDPHTASDCCPRIARPKGFVAGLTGRAQRRAAAWPPAGALRVPPATVSKKRFAEPVVNELRIKATPTQPVRLLSGGNQQKVVLAKWLAGDVTVFIFDEPTRGVDVGAKVEIYNLMNRLTAEAPAFS